MLRQAWRRGRTLLRGPHTLATRPWPIGEALHPVVALAVVGMVVNDWLFKPGGVSRAAPWLTGKLSDVCGLVLAPLVLSALGGIVLHVLARLGVRVDPSLSRGRLALCCIVTGGVFVLVKTWPPATTTVAHAWSMVAPGARIVVDPTDLVALPMVLVAWRIGLAEIARVPLGRVAAIRALELPPGPALRDVIVAGAPIVVVEALVAALTATPVVAAEVDALLADLAGNQAA